MDNYNVNVEEEIEEDIQIEEDEDVNNNKNTTTNNNNTTNGNLMYEDDYETVNDEILKSMSMLSKQTNNLNVSIKKLEKKNKSKMNKLELLLSQKFLNIFISILSSNIKKNFKVFLTNLKSLIMFKYNMNNFNKKNNKNTKKRNISSKNNKNIVTRPKTAVTNNAPMINYKVPKYYIEGLKKQEERKMKKEMIKKHHEEIKQKKALANKQKEKEKTSTEIEYEKYQYQKKLEKLNEIERQKYKEDLIKKETYADNIYKFIKKKQFFTILKFNLEIRSVVTIFLTNINNKMIKINGLRTMVKVRKIMEQKRLNKEKLDNLNADMFHKQKLQKRFFKFLYKVKRFSVKENMIITNNILFLKTKKYFLLLRKMVIEEKKEDIRKSKVIIDKHMLHIKRQMFYVLMHYVKEKKDEMIKEDLMSKLRNKAHELLRDYE